MPTPNPTQKPASRLGLIPGICAAALLAVPLLGAGPISAAPTTDDITGTVTLGGKPVAEATVRIFATGSRPGEAREIGTTTTGKAGRFSVADIDSGAAPVIYAQASRGDLPARLTLQTAIPVDGPTSIAINERTTVAASYALAQFTQRSTIGGPDVGVTNAAGMAANLVDPSTGQISDFLASAPNGTRTQTLATLNSLANIVVTCGVKPGVCRWLARYTSGSTTVQSLANLAADPSRNAGRIAKLERRTDANRPRLTKKISAWILALKFVGDGRQFRGPGNFVFDSQGDLWITNNYVPANRAENVCGGKALLKLEPTSPNQSVTEYFGGGVDGAGFGIALDVDDNVWISNYGFKGTECDDEPVSNSLSAFTPAGDPLSPNRTGFTAGDLSWPQGIARNLEGDLLTASCGNDSVVVYPDADPTRASSLGGNGINRPFDIDIDSAGNSWITNVAGNSVSAFDSRGNPLEGSPFTGGDLDRPLGIAIDDLDGKWISNSVVILLPCGHPTDTTPVEPGRITHIDSDGDLTAYYGGGLRIPWGIAVDGDNQVWVANFAGKRVSRFCGPQTEQCPRGRTTGEAISGKRGYRFDGFVRLTGIGIDPSGNVWTANNWKMLPIQSDPGGDGMVAIIGAAAPVSTS